MLKGFLPHTLIPQLLFHSPRPALTLKVTLTIVRTSRLHSTSFKSHPVRRHHNYSTMARTYPEALRLLNTLQSNFAVTSLFTPTPSSSNEPKPDLNAQAIPEMLHWLKRAGYTPSDLIPLNTIHVAGTKGKGSVTALCTSILLRYAIAERVGTYTSPHLASVRERIMLDGMPISRELFTKYFFELWDRFEASAAEAGEENVQGPGSKPFYFRYLTIMAWHVFLQEGVKSMVMECGIGGEYDATNVIPAEAVTAAVVTQLGIDHVAMLGDTVEKIAWHKAGIFKQGVRAYTIQARGEDAYEVMDVLKKRAIQKGADLVVLTDEFEDQPLLSEPTLAGPFQGLNRVLAIWAAREHLVRLGERRSLEGQFVPVKHRPLQIPKEFKEGLETASLRGRSEIFWDEENQIEWYLDGAHTQDSLEGVGDWWARASQEDSILRCLLFNQQERDSQSLLIDLLEEIGRSRKEKDGEEDAGFDLAVFSRNELDTVEGQPAGDLSVQLQNCYAMRQLDEGALVTTQPSVRLAVDEIKKFAKKATDIGHPCKVLVTGSFHLVGAVIRCIDPNVED
jgi:folylpolyglutamate synthase